METVRWRLMVVLIFGCALVANVFLLSWACPLDNRPAILYVMSGVGIASLTIVILIIGWIATGKNLIATIFKLTGDEDVFMVTMGVLIGETILPLFLPLVVGIWIICRLQPQ